jgi:predicted DCC family thiol-disulfide oxidoreductase YuxK
VPEVPAGTPRPNLNAALVWDGDCGFCARAATRVQRMRRRPLVVAWQDIDDLDSYGLTARECHDALQWVEPGRKESGARAVGRLLRHQGRLWPLVAWMPFVWPFSVWAEATYRWVARNRYKLPGGTAACAMQEQREKQAQAREAELEERYDRELEQRDDE